MRIELILNFMQFSFQLIIFEFEFVDHNIGLLWVRTDLPW